MGMCVCAGANLMCTFGTAPQTLIVTSNSKTLVSSIPAATIMDHKPIANIPPFAMCSSLANPTVAAATAAALGVLTPMPCVPNTPAPWLPGAPKTLVGKFPALGNDSSLICAYGGTIKVIAPGQTKVLLGQ